MVEEGVGSEKKEEIIGTAWGTYYFPSILIKIVVGVGIIKMGVMAMW
jgi:hypothetical protein